MAATSIAPAPPQDDGPVMRSTMNAALAGVEARLLSIVSQSQAGSVSPGMVPSAGASASPTALLPTPFSVWWDPIGKAYRMAVPEGSVMVEGLDVKVEVPDKLEAESTYYLHVKLRDQSGFDQGEPNLAKVDSVAAGFAYDLTVPVVKIGEMGIESQFLTSALILHRKVTRRPFDPKYDADGNLTGEVFHPYVMAGRKIVEVGGEIAAGATYGIRVEHTYDGEVVATIRTIDGVKQDNEDTGFTYVPLYKIGQAGDIIEDYRGIPCVPLYDPKSGGHV